MRGCNAVRSVGAGLALVLSAFVETPAQTWVDLTPVAGNAPAGRRNASAVFDPIENRMVVFGGFSSTYLGDIWAFDLDTNTWSELTPAFGPTPAPRLTPASVYDPFEHRMLTWSGQGPGVFFNDVWAFDLYTDTWSIFSPAGGPPNIRYGVGAAFDPLARDLVTFAGFTNQGRFHDVWRFDGSPASTWTNVSPLTGPEERCLHSACYDAQRHRMIVYGGQHTGPLDDIWALDLNTDTWTDLTPAVKPGGRYFTALVYDVTNHRATVFSGQGVSTSSNEVWAFDLWTNLWTLLVPTGTPPSPRYGSAGIYDQANDRMVVFGGFDTVARNDVWAVEGLSGTTTGAATPTTTVTLHPNYPNPLNPQTTIEFEVPSTTHVRLRVYDVNGGLVRTLVDQARGAGLQRALWDGRRDNGSPAGSGVYFCRLDALGQGTTRKMVLLR